MNIQHKWKGFSPPPGIAVLACLGAGLLFSLILHDAFDHSRSPMPAIMLSQVSERDAASPLSSAGAGVAPSPIRLEMDATQPRAADSDLLQNVRDDITSAAGPARSLAGISRTSTDETSISSDWNLWGRLASPRASATLLDTPPEAGVRTFAVHSLEGSTLCLINRTQLKIPLQLSFHVPNSIYKLERLTFTPRVDTPGSQKPARFSSLPTEIATRTDARLDQLQGRDLTFASRFGFLHTLKPGQICLIRLTDTAFESRVALNQVRSQLKTLNKASSELSSRLHVIFEGTASFEKALAGGSHMTPERRRSQIHRFLLVLGQAQSLHHNFLVARTVEAEQGDAFMASLERLNTALADTSAALLGLVPQVEIEPEDTPAVRTQTTHSLTPVSQTDAEVHTARMTISLTNSGGHSAGLVKIGVALSTLPASIRCEPEEPALFGTLTPGQTVRAAYLLHWSGPLSLPCNRCVGDISYFMDGAPAHLRPRPW